MLRRALSRIARALSRRFSGAAGSAGRLVADRKGNYSIGFALAMLPILGGVSLAVDYSDMIRQKQAMLNALDAAGIATARRIVEGATESEIRAYAKDFFEANLGPVNAADTVLSVQLPTNTSGGGTLKLSATLDYRPYFLPSFRYLLTGTPDNEPVAFSAGNELRLKNTLEVALALDNSGSMSNLGSGSGQKRIDLLKAAAKQLVDTLVQQAALIKQVDRPVQFSLVPFAASVNVGPGNAGAAWMDGEGVSPVHHENFDWSTMSSGNRRAEKVAGVWFKKGSDWGVEENEILSRFSLYKDMKKVDTREWVVTGSEYVCPRYRSNGTCREGYWRETGYYEETLGPYASWQGCVEARPYPYNIDDTPPAVSAGATGVWTGDTATLFVPMFAPDEAGDRWATDADSSPDNYSAPNNWWNDGTEASSASIRQRNMPKFFEVRPYGTTSPQGTGPNYSCTTNPITPLTDVSTADGLTAIKTAIDAMAPSGGTNVPEGLAWGWRTVSGGEPFTQGRPEIEKGNDKIVILLTAPTPTTRPVRSAIRIMPTTSQSIPPMAIPAKPMTAAQRPDSSWARAARSAISTTRIRTIRKLSTSSFRHSAAMPRPPASWSSPSRSTSARPMRPKMRRSTVFAPALPIPGSARIPPIRRSLPSCSGTLPAPTSPRSSRK